MNPDEFEYMGTEMLVWKKGQEAVLHHKILVKEKVLNSLIAEYENQDKFFIPLKGKIYFSNNIDQQLLLYLAYKYLLQLLLFKHYK